MALLSVVIILCGNSSASRASGIDSLSKSSTVSSNAAIQPSYPTFDTRKQLPGIFDMITNIPGDWKDYSVQTFKARNLPIIGGLTVLTAGLILTDNPTWQPFKRWYEQSKSFKAFSDGFEFVGDGKFQFGLAGLFGTYGFIAHDSVALRTASQTVEVILACGGVVQLLKHLTGRESPFVSTQPTGAWRFFPNQIDYLHHVPHYDAFPSGHIATATATFIVIANNYPDSKWIRPVGYAALACVSTALVATSIHWWSDIPLGVALGYGFGQLISPSSSHEEAATQQEPNASKNIGELLRNAQIVPSFGNGAAGMSLIIRL